MATKDEPLGPVLSDKGRQAAAERKVRQAAALRKNLRRRKLQRHTRAETVSGRPDSEEPASGG